MAGSAEMADVEVAIVGYGPVGATLAALLGKQGIRTLVLEREGAAYHLPRAVHFDAEVMRVFQAMGVAEAVAAGTRLSPGMRFVDAAGRLLLDWSRPPEIGPEGWHASYRFHQPELERVLRGAVTALPAVSVRTRAEVFALDQDPDGISIRWEDLASGRLRATRARWVIGCDGARSLVRRFMGAEWLDLGFHERWLVTDLILTRPRPDLGEHSIQFCDPARAATYVRGVGERRRWEIALKPEEDAAAMTRPEEVWRLLAPWITPADAAPVVAGIAGDMAQRVGRRDVPARHADHHGKFALVVELGRDARADHRLPVPHLAAGEACEECRLSVTVRPVPATWSRQFSPTQMILSGSGTTGAKTTPSSGMSAAAAPAAMRRASSSRPVASSARSEGTPIRRVRSSTPPAARAPGAVRASADRKVSSFTSGLRQMAAASAARSPASRAAPST